MAKLFKLETAKILEFHFQKVHPPLLSNLFFMGSDISTKVTRSFYPSTSSIFYIPKFQSSTLKKSIIYQGERIWNEIPFEIKSKNFNELELQYKSYLLKQY